MRLAPKALEPPAKMLGSPPLGIRARRPRPETVDKGLSLGEGVDANVLVHVLRYARRGSRIP